MGNIEAAQIRCTECGCEMTYTGPDLVGDKLCGSCGHALRAVHKFVTPSGRTLQGDRVPDDFFTLPEFK